MSPERSAAAFVTSMSDQREVFDILRAEVDKRGYLGKASPILHRQATYYESYIRPSHKFLKPKTFRNNATVGSSSPRSRFKLNCASNMSLGDDYNELACASSRNNTIERRRKPFVPLRDLLKKGHQERV